MTVKCRDIAKWVEGLAPLHLAEDWDNVGLMVGGYDREVRRVLVCLDVTAQTVEEAVSRDAQLIVSHHPFIFKGLKRIVEDDVKGRLIHKLIKHDISVYSAHTNLDVTEGGINEHLAGLLGLSDINNLKDYKAEKLFKVVVFVPQESIDAVRDAMCRAGAGWIGNYSDCTFVTKGTGTFKPLEGTNPYVGSKGNLEKVEEYRLETIVPQGLLKKVVAAMLEAHPYEEVAYDVYTLEINGKQYGLGKTGTLSQPQKLDEFIATVKTQLNVDKVKIIGSIDREIKKVAVFCGSFDENYGALLKAGVDVLVTGDVKYHAALDISEMGLCVIDAGHFGTERIIVSKVVEMMMCHFPGIEVFASYVENDPIKIT